MDYKVSVEEDNGGCLQYIIAIIILLIVAFIVVKCGN